MPRKKKPKPFRAGKAVRSAARAIIGSPRPGRPVPSKKKKASDPKHKPSLRELLDET